MFKLYTENTVNTLKNEIEFLNNQTKNMLEEANYVLPELRTNKPMNGVPRLWVLLDQLSEDNEYINPNHKYLRLNAFKEIKMQIRNILFHITTDNDKVYVLTYLIDRVGSASEKHKILLSKVVVENPYHCIDLMELLPHIVDKKFNSDSTLIGMWQKSYPVYYSFIPKDEYKEGIDLKWKELNK